MNREQSQLVSQSASQLGRQAGREASERACVRALATSRAVSLSVLAALRVNARSLARLLVFSSRLRSLCLPSHLKTQFKSTYLDESAKVENTSFSTCIFYHSQITYASSRFLSSNINLFKLIRQNESLEKILINFLMSAMGVPQFQIIYSTS